jgi:hypothetical protein
MATARLVRMMVGRTVADLFKGGPGRSGGSQVEIWPRGICRVSFELCGEIWGWPTW